MNFVLINSLSHVTPEQRSPQNIFVTPDGEAYTWENYNDQTLHGIGGFFKSLGKALLPVAGVAASFIPGVGAAASKAIGLIGQVGAGALAGSGGGAGGTLAKGLAAISAKGAASIAAFDQIKAAIGQQGVDLNAVNTAADQLAASFSDPAQFYQAKKGKDAEALANFKTQAAAKAAEIHQLTAQFAAAEAERLKNLPQSATNPTGTPTAGNIAELELTPTNLAIGAAAVFGIFWMMRSKS